VKKREGNSPNKKMRDRENNNDSKARRGQREKGFGVKTLGEKPARCVVEEGECKRGKY